jgi:predicted nucleotidyltransferase
MVSIKTIMSVSDQIAREFQPEQIVLFGSHAYGTPRNDSDVDLLVVMPFEGHSAYMAITILDRVNPPFPIDLLVRTPEELRHRIALNDFFLREIIAKGSVLYAAPHN